MDVVGMAAGIVGTAADALEVLDCRLMVYIAVGALMGARILLVEGVLGRGYVSIAALRVPFLPLTPQYGLLVVV